MIRIRPIIFIIKTLPQSYEESLKYINFQLALLNLKRLTLSNIYTLQKLHSKTVTSMCWSNCSNAGAAKLIFLFLRSQARVVRLYAVQFLGLWARASISKQGRERLKFSRLHLTSWSACTRYQAEWLVFSGHLLTVQGYSTSMHNHLYFCHRSLLIG